MRKSLPFLILIVLYLSMTSTAMAEKYYFYKEVGKKLPKGQKFDSYYLPDTQEKFNGGLFVSFLLPGEPRNTHNEFSLGLDCAVDPRRGDRDNYLFFVEQLAIRDEHRIYPLEYNVGNVTPANPRYRKLVAYEMADGKIRTKYDIEVKQGDPTMPSFTFRSSPLPKNLFLDYKFRIRKENGKEEIFEGTIPLELASYNVGWWEKTRW